MRDDELQVRGTAFNAMLAERRMLWIGAAALFGFQFLAVFTAGFAEGLDRTEQQVHLAATGLTALSIAVLLVPAAYVRSADVSLNAPEFIGNSVRSLRVGMCLLGAATVLDFFLVACVVLRNQFSFAVALALVAAFVVLWYILPRAR